MPTWHCLGKLELNQFDHWMVFEISVFFTHKRFVCLHFKRRISPDFFLEIKKWKLQRERFSVEWSIWHNQRKASSSQVALRWPSNNRRVWRIKRVSLQIRGAQFKRAVNDHFYNLWNMHNRRTSLLSEPFETLYTLRFILFSFCSFYRLPLGSSRLFTGLTKRHLAKY